MYKAEHWIAVVELAASSVCPVDSTFNCNSLKTTLLCVSVKLRSAQRSSFRFSVILDLALIQFALMSPSELMEVVPQGYTHTHIFTELPNNSVSLSFSHAHHYAKRSVSNNLYIIHRQRAGFI